MTLPFPFPLPQPAAVLLRILDALLRREGWAREQLAAHAGKSLRVSVGGRWQLQAAISSDGLLQACDPAIVPDVTMSLPAERLGQLPALLRERRLGDLASLAHIQGDAGLAQQVSALARDLRWDAEEDLSRLFGDVLGVRLARGLRALPAAAQAGAVRVRQGVAEFLGEESGIAVQRPPFEAWRLQVQGLHQRLDALDARCAARTSRSGPAC